MSVNCPQEWLSGRLPHRRILIPKRGGDGYRTIYVPRKCGLSRRDGMRRCMERTQRACCPRHMLSTLARLARSYSFCLGGRVFHPNLLDLHARLSVCQAAWPHAAAAWVGGVDIRDWYGSVDPREGLRIIGEHGVWGGVGLGANTEHALALTTLPGVPGVPQGWPTSPCIAHCCMMGYDRAMREVASRIAGGAYSRYADNIMVSAQTRSDAEALLSAACDLLHERGYQTHARFVRCAAVVGVRLCGVIVRADGRLHATRAARRLARAAQHSSPDSTRAAGLREWAEYPDSFSDRALVAIQRRILQWGR